MLSDWLYLSKHHTPFLALFHPKLAFCFFFWHFASLSSVNGLYALFSVTFLWQLALDSATGASCLGRLASWFIVLVAVICRSPVVALPVYL